MNLQDIASNPRTIQLGMRLSQHIPASVAHRLAWLAANVVCQVKPAVYRVVWANLNQVLGSGVEWQILERTVRQVFYTTIRSHYDLFRALLLPREEQARLVEFSLEAQELARSLRHGQKGSVLVLPHLGSFDIAGQAIASHLPETQVLTLSEPPAGFQLINKLRLQSGVEVTPLSSTALRKAIRLLRRGGMVSVAGDRPVSDLDEPISFFGRPARLPSGHVRLALKTDAVVVVGCCFLSPETGRYTIHVGPPLEMVRTGNLDEEVRLNMRQVLDGLESIIRRWVGQWQMYVPVWPELLEA
jgi:KDO2-lipid IV(A) lauroyltransferase